VTERSISSDDRSAANNVLDHVVVSHQADGIGRRLPLLSTAMTMSASLTNQPHSLLRTRVGKWMEHPFKMILSCKQVEASNGMRTSTRNAFFHQRREPRHNLTTRNKPTAKANTVNQGTSDATRRKLPRPGSLRLERLNDQTGATTMASATSISANRESMQSTIPRRRNLSRTIAKR